MSPLGRLWSRLPLLLRAVITGALIAGIGWLPWSFMVGANLRYAPAFPLATLAMLVYLWLFFLYLNGQGWPNSTSESRRLNLRALSLSRRVWIWSLIAGGLASVALRALLDLVRRLSIRPGQDLFTPEQVAAYPFFTLLCLFVMAAFVAGCVEEAAFRGYMQAPLERRYGPAKAITIVSLLFVLAHYRFGVADPWPWLIFAPAYFAVGCSLGILTYLSGSILPAIIFHTAIDAVAFLRYWWMGVPKSVWEVGFDASFWLRCIVIAVFGLASIWGYRRLAAIVRQERDLTPAAPEL